MDMEKTYHLEGKTLVVTFRVKNVGPEAIHATEFSHNFFRFDDRTIDSSYQLFFPYSIKPELRRGELIMTRDAYRLGAFDGPTESTAFWIRGWEGLSSHWMRLENKELGMSVLMEDDVPICRFYSWNNFNAFCPEVFAPIDLEPGQEVTYTRKYTFDA
jgi:galactose mutarotase-like enzyme